MICDSDGNVICDGYRGFAIYCAAYDAWRDARRWHERIAYYQD